jgi:hypothetical protein
MTCTGWTYSYVEEELDMPLLVMLAEEWEENPPVHMLLAAFMGYKPKSKSRVNDPAELAALVSLLRPEGLNGV